MGAPTVAATMILAARAGIEVFATGGIGGVHQGAEESFDVSADLMELAETPVTVVSAGAKAILDMPKTLEVLETLGVAVIGYRTDRFPAFWSRDSGLAAPDRLDSPDAIAAAHRMRAALGIGGGVLMLAAMAQVVPVAALIPLHGVVQLGSNVSRVVLQIRWVSWPVLVPFLVGGAVGAVAGGTLVQDLPDGILLVAIGAFVSVSTWGKVPPRGQGQWAVMAGGGFVATLLTMFVGATGPVTVALCRPAQLAH